MIDILMVAAYKKEVQSFLERAKNVSKVSSAGLTYYQGEYCQQKITFLITGQGHKNCTRALQAIKKKWPASERSWLINVGFAGALTSFYDWGSVLQVGTVLSCSGKVEGDSSLAIGQGLAIARLVCSEKPIMSSVEKNKLLAVVEADLVDMESKGFLSVAFHCSKRVSIFKVVSDYADEEAPSLIIKKSYELSQKLENAVAKMIKEQLGLEP